MAAHNELGQLGENIAASYLENQGYTILERNNRLHHWEVDLIALKEGVVAFVEVKTRMSEAFQRAEEAVDVRKARRLRVIADRYMRSHHRQESARLDIIAVVKEGEGFTVRHTKGVFDVYTIPYARGFGDYSRSRRNSFGRSFK